jgi:hypothetical protein
VPAHKIVLGLFSPHSANVHIKPSRPSRSTSVRASHALFLSFDMHSYARPTLCVAFCVRGRPSVAGAQPGAGVG